MARPLVAEINLKALRHNYQLACQQSARDQALAVIKADAYGHGAIQVAKALEDMAPAFAVAAIEEAETLVAAGIKQPIVLLEGFFSADELPLIHQRGYPLVIHSSWQVDALSLFFKQDNQDQINPLQIWLKVDTGMHRLGFAPDQAVQVHTLLKQQPWVKEIILTSHLACADDLNNPFTQQQLSTLFRLKNQLGTPVSLANSPATLGWPSACEGWLRPGIMLYGASPLKPGHPLGDQLQTVMTLKSRLISVRQIAAGEKVGYGGRFVAKKPTQIGVVACGYGDGYPRQAVDGTPVGVRGQVCQLAGRVSMDMMTVDLGNLDNPQPGDEVELWGPQIDVNEVANHCDTISYTLLTGLLPRVKRLYI
ncbi:alanine racemase [Marinospirillum celere]|uniref:Alanine racemase n=1 Tax=Marinospirillum celere TaxID=1122252 RepID=A0A1I1EVQ5_9GAMM|nr:alanine racemase [Marinospirillum celere]SFB89568.1 alanine racemase [Marinospirillum celere]